MRLIIEGTPAQIKVVKTRFRSLGVKFLEDSSVSEIKTSDILDTTLLDEIKKSYDEMFESIKLDLSNLENENAELKAKIEQLESVPQVEESNEPETNFDELEKIVVPEVAEKKKPGPKPKVKE